MTLSCSGSISHKHIIGVPPPAASFDTSSELDPYADIAESPADIGVDGADVATTTSLPPSSPFVINRYFRQARSVTGKLAYVIFSLEDCGVYYNW